MSHRSLSSLPAHKVIPQLLEKHGGLIYTLGRRLCGSPEDAEDLVQETFFVAFRNWEQFEGRADPKTWLYTIASRACQRMHRRRAGEPRRVARLSELLPSDDNRVPVLPTAEEGPDLGLLRKEARETVERAIGTIPLHFRLPLVLKEIADFSLAEIAEILGLKKATVKTRVHRGRLLLRKALEENLPTRKASPPDHPKRVCLDLLLAKQESLDRGAPFPYPPGELCSRCKAMFATLDLAHDVCVGLARGELPPELRQALREELADRPVPNESPSS